MARSSGWRYYPSGSWGLKARPSISPLAQIETHAAALPVAVGFGGVVVMLLSTDAPHQVQTAGGVAANAQGAARSLCDGFHRMADGARQKGYVCSTTVTLVDGLSGAGERFVESIVENTQALHQVVGGAAGDEGKFQATHVGEPERSGSDMAAAVHVFGRTPFGVGIGHGLEATTAKMRVSRAKGTSCTRSRMR